jgi:hypothetical protein
MASYPGAVKTFTNRSAGQTIEAAHMNEVQDEINAIESGILNGTATVTCSNATVQRFVAQGNAQLTNSSFSGSISVAGGSTMFALQSGNSTFSGTVGFPNGISATLSTGDTHNWNPTGVSSAVVIRMTGNSSGSTLTGITGGVAGRWLTLVNITAAAIVLSNNDAGSSAACRFILKAGADFSMGSHTAVQLWHDPVDGCWRQISQDA